MKTSTIEVGELVSSLSAAGVQRQLATLPGVHHADVNYVAGSATVHYDEARLSLETIRQRVVACGYHCRGELAPAHACNPTDRKVAADPHAGHVMSSSADGQLAGVDPIATNPATPAQDRHAGRGGHGGLGAHAGHAETSAGHKADMMHDMGHAPGMSMEDMARDMRNRFLEAPDPAMKRAAGASA